MLSCMETNILLNEINGLGEIMKKFFLGLIVTFFCVVNLMIGYSSANPVSILNGGSGSNQGPVIDLGLFTAGIYNFSGWGQMDLLGGNTFTLGADGIPVNYPPGVTAPGYDYFNPGGSDNDYGVYGAAGQGVNLGTIIYTFESSPSWAANSSGWDQWYTIGLGTTVTVPSDRHIYVSYNDTYYRNNKGEFFVSWTERPDPVPEPATLLLFGAGIVGLAAVRRRKK